MLSDDKYQKLYLIPQNVYGSLLEKEDCIPNLTQNANHLYFNNQNLQNNSLIEDDLKVERNNQALNQYMPIHTKVVQHDVTPKKN